MTDVRSVALGECDPAKGYTGPLRNPPGIRSGDKGCGCAYGAIAWNTGSYEQRSAVLNLDHPLTEDADLHLDANVTQGESAFRYAPSIDSFAFTPNPGLLDAINDEAGSDFEADGDDQFVVAHRFVGHGNRDWLTDTEEYDVSVGVEGRLADDLGYDARISAYRLDGFRVRPHLRTCRQDYVGNPSGTLRLVDPFSGTGHSALRRALEGVRREAVGQ